MALIGSFEASNTAACVAQYIGSGIWFVLFAVYVIVRRPFRSHFQNFSQILMFIILGLVCFSGAISQVERKVGEQMVSYMLLVQSGAAIGISAVTMLLLAAEILFFRRKFRNVS